MTKRYIVIGDIHGCVEELNLLIEKVKPTHKDVVVSIGDVVDKGPDSSGAVRFLYELKTHTEVVLVEGNHENKHIRYRKHLQKGRDSVAEKMAERTKELPILAENLSAKEWQWLVDSAVLFYRIPKHNMLCVHGGVPASIKTLPHEKRGLAMSSKDRKFFGQLLRTRYLDKDTGKMLSLQMNKPGDPFWTETYDGRFGTVLYGHQPWMRDDPLVHEHAIGIDLGCVYGGRLCAMVLSENGSYHVTVKALAKYAEPLAL